MLSILVTLLGNIAAILPKTVATLLNGAAASRKIAAVFRKTAAVFLNSVTTLNIPSSFYVI